MSKNDNVPAMYLKIPTVAALNQVPGFDLMKLLCRMVSPKTGEEVFRLDLQYKKLWFRLAHPRGRIRLKPLRITEQLAILRGASAAAPEARKAEQLVASAAPTYTKDMPVEQIVELMKSCSQCCKDAWND